MTIGRPLTKSDIDQTSAALAGQLLAVSDDIKKFQAIMDAYSSAQVATNFSYTQAEADQLKSAIADMSEVANFLQGGTPGAARDRRTFMRQLLGTGVY